MYYRLTIVSETDLSKYIFWLAGPGTGALNVRLNPVYVDQQQEHPGRLSAW